MKNIYTIYDVVAEVFNRPFFDINHASAMRGFENSILQHSPINKNDYALYHIGSFDEQSGIIEPLKIPFKLMSGFDIKVNSDNLDLFDNNEDK